MTGVRPKKNLGQHFLTDLNIAGKIAGLLTGTGSPKQLIEIGPGTGILTRFLLEKPIPLLALDVDEESVTYLKKNFPADRDRFLLQDFLKCGPAELGEGPLAIIGNFPYNISSQIFFHILEWEIPVTEVVCMLQREVARRIASGPGSREYGILSVLLQSRFSISYAFTVGEEVFHPPPKVKSGVIRLEKRPERVAPCRFSSLNRVVKQAFSMRRKTLRNALKPLGYPQNPAATRWLDKRAEELSVDEFEVLTACYEEEGLLGKTGK
jgi:16S rRNA (adenine1518-N6/adenine1519-N6)-dimethyltransferase